MAAYKNRHMIARLPLDILRRAMFPRVKYFCAQTTAPLTFDNVQIKSVEDIPGPQVVPFLGTAYRLLFTTQSIGTKDLELQLQDFQRYGPLVKHSLAGVPSFRVYDPSDAEKVLRSESKYPIRLGDMPLIKHYSETRKKTSGVFFLDGEEWHKHRSVISKRVLRSKELADYAPVFSDIIGDLITRLRHVRGNQGLDNEIPDIDKELFKWSFESVAYVLFDKRFHALEDRPDPHSLTFIESIGRFNEGLYKASLVPVWFNKYIYQIKSFKSFMENFDKFYSYAELCIAQKIGELEEQGKPYLDETEERADFLKFLLSSKQLTKEDLLASVIDLLFAGVDTTANTMQWALYMMGKNPDKQQLLYKEVRTVVRNGEQATVESLARMPYLKAWVKETLRLYPVLAVLIRKLNKDMVLSSCNIPAGSQVNIMLYAISRNENIFKDADRFKPERWLRQHQEECDQKFSGFAYLPFGFGARMCLGRRLAEMELHLLIARVVQEFYIQYPHPEDVHPVVRGTTIPERALRVKFVDRG